MRGRIMIILSIILTAIVAVTGLVTAMLLDEKDKGDELIIGDVWVEIEVKFERMNEDGSTEEKTTGLDYIAEVYNQGTFEKTGVIKVNISNRNNIDFIENFRVNIKVYSSVNTFFRIAPLEQLTLTYIAGGVTREVAITQREYIRFNYDPEGKLYDNRNRDGFFYTNKSVIRDDVDTPDTIVLIGEYPENENFLPYDNNYSLQIGFIIEAVQASGGPENKWKLTETPWGTSWEDEIV